MQALTCVNWWQKSGIFLPISIVLRIRHLGEGTINDVMMMRWCHDNDVMIAATLHWLLLVMWHANHLINSHVIGKPDNQYLPKKHETRFYEWNGAFRTFGQIRVMSFRSPRWNPCTASLHLMSPLENIATNFLHFVSWIPMILISCRSSQKMYWVGDFNAFWARVGRVNGIRDRVTDLSS